jgi:phosphatidylglycerophosphate synthase
LRLAPEHIMSLPNALTLVRVPLAGLLWVAPDSQPWFFAILATAALSDMLDGRVARALRARHLARGGDAREIGEAAATGAWLDPACDKLFVVSAVAAVAWTYHPPASICLLVATREIILVPFVLGYWLARRIRRKLRIDFRAGVLGKTTTVAQFGAIVSIPVWPAATGTLAVVAALVGLAASADYLRRGVVMASAAAGQPMTYERWLEIQKELRASQRVMRRP